MSKHLSTHDAKLSHTPRRQEKLFYFRAAHVVQDHLKLGLHPVCAELFTEQQCPCTDHIQLEAVKRQSMSSVHSVAGH